MKRLVLFLGLMLAVTGLQAQTAPAAEGAPPPASDPNTAAAAAVATGHADPQVPDFLGYLVDLVLEAFDVRTSENTATHYGIALLIVIISLVLRRVMTSGAFSFLKVLAARSRTRFDDRLLPALEAPVSAAIVVVGCVAALKVLRLSPEGEMALRYGSTMAWSLVVFWLFLRVFTTLLDHLAEVALERKLGVAAFMPWIKRSILTIIFVFGVLLIAQSLGANVKAFLAGLGIGGLAFALAAQDTLANLFGSVVVAVDQPFRIGDSVQIGPHTGQVEDIGLRSTKLRTPTRSLVVLPNKMVAAEAITNLSKFTQRRSEQVIGLTYDTRPDRMEAFVEEIRRLLLAEAEIDPASVMVFFRDYSASSLDVWVAYTTRSPDFPAFMRLRQRLNLAFMRTVGRLGLAFAFPTQTVRLEGEGLRPAPAAPAPEEPGPRTSGPS